MTAPFIPTPDDTQAAQLQLDLLRAQTGRLPVRLAEVLGGLLEGLCCLNCNAGKLRPTNENSSCRCARLDHQRKLEAKGVEMLERLVAGCGQQCGAEIHPSF